MNTYPADDATEYPDIIAIYHNRCVRCWKVGSLAVHEIVPKSKSRNWKRFDNRIPLCTECHTYVHKYGALNFADKLRKLRVERLETLYASHKPE